MMHRKAQQFVDHHRLQRSLSQKSKLNKPRSQPPTPKNKPEEQSIIRFQASQVTELLQQFEKQIKKQIIFHCDVLNSRSLPKCFQHNNIQTMYCLTDKKPLCVNCLYVSNLHKPHKVVPLQKANLQVQQNIKDAVAMVRRKLQECQKIIQINEQFLQKSQTQFPLLIQNVHNFYLSFHELLVNKKSQHLQEISQFWAKVRHTYYSRKTNLNNIKSFIQYHLDNCTRIHNENTSLHTRNVVTDLAKIEYLLDEQLSLQKKSFFKADLQKFKEIRDNVEKDMVFRMNYTEVKKDINFISNINKSQKRAFMDKMKKSKQSKQSKQSKEKPIKKQQLIIQTPKSQTEQSSKSNTPKNRHSKTDLFSKSQIMKKRKSLEINESRLKKQQFHRSIMMKNSKQKTRVEILGVTKTPTKSISRSPLKKR